MAAIPLKHRLKLIGVQSTCIQSTWNTKEKSDGDVGAAVPAVQWLEHVTCELMNHETQVQIELRT